MKADREKERGRAKGKPGHQATEGTMLHVMQTTDAHFWNLKCL